MLVPLLMIAPVAIIETASPLTLAAAAREAVENNPSLRQVDADADAAAAQVRVASAWPETSLSYQAWQQPWSRPLDPSATNMHMFGVRQMLPFPGQLSHGSSAAAADARAQRADVQAARLSIEAQLAHGLTAYWLVLEELRFHEEHLKLAAQILEASRARYAAGEATQAELLRAEGELHRLHSSVQGLRLRVDAAVAFVKAVLGRTDDNPLGSPPPPEDVAPSDGVERPEVIAAVERSSSAVESERVTSSARRFPQVMVGFDYMLMPGMPDAYSVMLQVPLPWLSRKRDAEADRARAQVLSAEWAVKSARNVTRYELADARARVAAARAELRVLEQMETPIVERAYEATQGNYVAGAATLADVLQASSALLDTHLQTARQRAALSDAIADLRRALGVDLVDGGSR